MQWEALPGPELLPIADHGPSSDADMSVLSVNKDFGDDKDTERVDARLSLASDSVEDAAFEKRLVRKLDMRIMPIVCILYLFACKLICTRSMLELMFRSPGQIEPGQCPFTRTTSGYARGRPYRKVVRLGKLGVLFLLCKFDKTWTQSAD